MKDGLGLPCKWGGAKYVWEACAWGMARPAGLTGGGAGAKCMGEAGGMMEAWGMARLAGLMGGGAGAKWAWEAGGTMEAWGTARLAVAVWRWVAGGRLAALAWVA